MDESNCKYIRIEHDFKRFNFSPERRNVFTSTVDGPHEFQGCTEINVPAPLSEITEHSFVSVIAEGSNKRTSIKVFTCRNDSKRMIKIMEMRFERKQKTIFFATWKSNESH